MLMPPESIRVFLRRDPTDLRLEYNGLSALAGSVFGQNPASSHLFGFVNRQRSRAKMLLWERGGYWLMSRRLKPGTFALPEAGAESGLPVNGMQWAMFLGGVVAERIRRKEGYSPLPEYPQ